MFAILLLALVVGFVMSGGFGEIKSTSQEQKTSASSTPIQKKIDKIILQESVFVPYWTLQYFTPEKEKTYFYFGVLGNKQGINTQDIGYERLDEYFAMLPKDAPRIVTIRMVDNSLNSQILKDKNAQKKIIDDTIKLAKTYDLDGVLFDFEMSSISFDAVTTRVTLFYKDFYTQIKDEGLAFYITMYGDTFYRVRPYDVKAINDYTDQIFIMAYDFHKARNNPGPNFPLNGRETYGYDFKKMVEDFKESIPLEKLAVVFGMFGYDWKLGEDGKSIEMAKALSLYEINKAFIESCEFLDCQKGDDVKSFESWIKYKDEQGSSHEVWFENEKSVKIKREYLHSMGIDVVSFWANSYY